MTSIASIATRLISLCNNHQFVEAYTELFSDNAISIDPSAGPEPVKGLAAMIEREKAFLAATQVHEIKVSEAIFSGSYFCVVISMHFTPNNAASRQVEELAMYRVENGKIISQQFFIG